MDMSNRILGNTPSQRNYQNQLIYPSLFCIEQECQESLIQGKISTNFKERSWILAKLSFRELCNSKLTDLHPFNNMAISLS